MLVGISTKAYLSRARTLEWLGELADLARGHVAVRSGAVELVVAPATPLLEAAVRLLDGTGVRVMAQDVSRFAGGAVTGEVVASLLADLGVRYVEIGHAERRGLLGETDAVVAEKVARSREAGLVPWLCVGEEARVGPAEAAASCLAQVAAAAPGGGPSSSPTSPSGRSARRSPRRSTTSCASPRRSGRDCPKASTPPGSSTAAAPDRDCWRRRCRPWTASSSDGVPTTSRGWRASSTRSSAASSRPLAHGVPAGPVSLPIGKTTTAEHVEHWADASHGRTASTEARGACRNGSTTSS